MAEKQLEVDLIVEPIWERREAFLSLNPAGTVPVLKEPDGSIIATSQAIAEYLEEIIKELQKDIKDLERRKRDK